MQQSLKDTTYPDFIKIGLGGALNGVEALTKKLSEAFFVVEQRNFEEKSTSIESLPTVGTVPSETAPEINETAEEAKEAISEEAQGESPAVTEEVITPSE